MKWILIVMFTTDAPGIPPHSLTLEFSDVQACEKAVPRIDNLTRRFRVMNSKMDWVCLPQSSPAP